MRTVVVALALTFFLLACSDPWSPLGTYNVIQVWKQGNCNLEMPRVVTLTVSLDPGEGSPYLLMADLGVEVEGVVSDSSDECTISFSAVEPMGTGLGFLGTALSIYNVFERDGDLSGSGTFTVGTPENCLQAFTVEGNKQ